MRTSLRMHVHMISLLLQTAQCCCDIVSFTLNLVLVVKIVHMLHVRV